MIQKIIKKHKICFDFLPINLAAVEAPTITDILGAINDIRDSTYA